MIEVILEKLSDDASILHVALHGQLLELELGRPLVLVRAPDSKRIVTSPVTSIFARARDELCVRTENSSYRVWIVRHDARGQLTPAPEAEDSVIPTNW